MCQCINSKIIKHTQNSCACARACVCVSMYVHVCTSTRMYTCREESHHMDSKRHHDDNNSAICRQFLSWIHLCRTNRVRPAIEVHHNRKWIGSARHYLQGLCTDFVADNRAALWYRKHARYLDYYNIFTVCDSMCIETDCMCKLKFALEGKCLFMFCS